MIHPSQVTKEQADFIFINKAEQERKELIETIDYSIRVSIEKLGNGGHINIDVFNKHYGRIKLSEVLDEYREQGWYIKTYRGLPPTGYTNICISKVPFRSQRILKAIKDYFNLNLK